MSHRRKLRNFLIDRKVQLRITLIMVALSSLLTAALGAYWYAEVRNASGVIRINAISVLGPEGARALGQELATQDMHRLLILVGFAVLMGLLIAGFGIVMTHRLAGPLFKINRHMEDIADGRLYKLWGLRKGDQLQDFFGTFQRMHTALRERTEDDMRLLGELINAIEGDKDLAGLVPKLRDAITAKGDSLRDATPTTQQLQRVER